MNTLQLLEAVFILHKRNLLRNDSQFYHIRKWLARDIIKENNYTLADTDYLMNLLQADKATVRKYINMNEDWADISGYDKEGNWIGGEDE